MFKTTIEDTTVCGVNVTEFTNFENKSPDIFDTVNHRSSIQRRPGKVLAPVNVF